MLLAISNTSEQLWMYLESTGFIFYMNQFSSSLNWWRMSIKCCCFSCVHFKPFLNLCRWLDKRCHSLIPSVLVYFLFPSKSAIKHAVTLTGVKPGKCRARSGRQAVITGNFVGSKAGTPPGSKEQVLGILLPLTGRPCKHFAFPLEITTLKVHPGR